MPLEPKLPFVQVMEPHAQTRTTHTYKQSSIWLSLDCARKLEFLEKTHREHANTYDV